MYFMKNNELRNHPPSVEIISAKMLMRLSTDACVVVSSSNQSPS